MWSVATASQALASSFWALLISRLVLGLGEALLVPPVYSMIASLFSARQRGTALAIFYCGVYLGGAFASLSTFLSAAMGWRATCALLGAVGLLLLALLLLLVPEPERGAPAAATGGGSGSSATEAAPSSAPSPAPAPAPARAGYSSIVVPDAPASAGAGAGAAQPKEAMPGGDAKPTVELPASPQPRARGTSTDADALLAPPNAHAMVPIPNVI